jgi:hypothetical protein
MTGAGDGTDSGRDLLEAARDYLERSGWDVERHPEEPLLRTVTESRDGTWTSYVRAREGEQQLVFYSVHPRSAPPEQLAEIAEFLHRVNYGTIIGNFELDYGDGEIRFKTSLDVEGEALTDVQLEKLTTYNVGAMGRHVPLIGAVIDGTLTALEAMEQVDLF